MWKHRRVLVERRAGALGRVVLPAMMFCQIALPLLAPLAWIAGVAALAMGNWRSALVATGCLFVLEAIQFAVACMLQTRSGGVRGWRLFPWLLGGRLLYRPLLLGVALRSIFRMLDGVPLGWAKLIRRGTVVDFAARAPRKLSAR
jgi:hypothetical protein